MLETNQIYNGNCLELMKFIDDDSINCCVTSPPYWALRDYQTEDLIWDGDSNCEHDWFKIDTLRKTTQGDKPSVNSKIAIKRTTFENRPGKPSNFCQKCGAWKGSFGLEPTFELYIKHLCDIFDEVKRCLKSEGTLWVNIGDSYSGSGKAGNNPEYQNKHTEFGKISTHSERFGLPTTNIGLPSKSLVMIPFRFAIEMVNRGWILRNTIIWHKPNCMPSSVKDRFTVDFEYLFFFVKNKKYYFEQQFEKSVVPFDDLPKRFGTLDPNRKGTQNAMKGIIKYQAFGYPQGRNKRTVWQISTKPFKEAHFACVSDDTECLTTQGWKKYNELNIGEIIATFNIKNKNLRWERLEDVYVYDYNSDLIETLNPNFNFLYTPNHRMVCRNWRAKTKRWSDFYIKQLSQITSYDRFPISSDWEEGSYNIISEDISPDLCEILGWISSEGHYRKYSIDIYQSLTRNKEKVDRIEKLLQKEKLEYSKRIQLKRTKAFANYELVCFTIAWKNASRILSLLPNKKPSWNMLLWKKEQIKRFILGFVYGDGHIRKDGRWSITQKNEETTDILQALLFRLGYSVKKSRHKNSGIFNLFITHKKLTSARKTNGSGLAVRNTHYEGKVWCPKTPSSTFVARRKGQIIITGNTYPPELIETPIKAGCPENGIVLDPFFGSGTTGVVCKQLNRNYIGLELNKNYCKIAYERIKNA